MTTEFRTREVRVLLSEDFARTMRGYDPDAPMTETIVLTVDDAESDEAACETAFAICNSYPDELHCPRAYAEQVAAYRAGGNRSLSVGDACIIGETTYSVDPAGFSVAQTPTRLLTVQS